MSWTLETTQFRQWVVQFERDPQQAIDRMIADSYDVLRRMARRMLRSYPRVAYWEDTDDVCQQSSIRFCSALRQKLPQSPVHFFRLAGVQIRRTLIDLARKHSGPRSFALTHKRLDDTALCAVPGPPGLADWADFHEQIDGLPAQEREMFDLLWYGGLSQQETADALGIDCRSVQRRWRTARLLLFHRRAGMRPIGE